MPRGEGRSQGRHDGLIITCGAVRCPSHYMGPQMSPATGGTMHHPHRAPAPPTLRTLPGAGLPGSAPAGVAVQVYCSGGSSSRESTHGVSPQLLSLRTLCSLFCGIA